MGLLIQGGHGVNFPGPLHVANWWLSVGRLQLSADAALDKSWGVQFRVGATFRVAESMGFKGDFRLWEGLLLMGE